MIPSDLPRVNDVGHYLIFSNLLDAEFSSEEVLTLKNVVSGWWLMVGDCIAARCDAVVRHRMGDPQWSRKVLSPNRQNPTTNCDKQDHLMIHAARPEDAVTTLATMLSWSRAVV